MRFSSRTAWQPDVNDWTGAVRNRRHSGRPLLDLTISNPTECGLSPDIAETLEPLSTEAALRYRPEPLGMTGARLAVAKYYSDHGVPVDPKRLCLCTSTSEAYSFLFRLLCDPGDEVLIARPSYPLFQLLADIDNVVLQEYRLFEEPDAPCSATGAWALDVASLHGAITPQTRAIIVVHPNNPTGHYLSRSERMLLVELCAERGLALIVDEVFLDYANNAAGEDQASFAAVSECLCFVLSGISKVCALPQMKASWILCCGPERSCEEAMRRIEILADTFLSMNAPVQYALPHWLAQRHGTQDRIRARMCSNLQALDARLEGSLGHRLPVEGGWTVILRVPRFVGNVSFAQAALQQDILVQPGSLYGLSDGRCVLSLLTPPDVWATGIAALPLGKSQD